MQNTMTDADITRQMVELYQNGMTSEDVGKKFGMSRQGVRARFVTAGIPRRQKLTFKDIDKDRPETLYCEDKLPASEIARELSGSKAVINRALKFHRIPKREPIKKGGYIVDFLRSLQINEKGIIEWRRNDGYAHLHTAAKLVGIKISTRMLGNQRFEITGLV